MFTALFLLYLFSGHEIEGLSESPKSPWFGLIDPRKTSTHDSKINFDANMFWTVGLLFKHFGTCGVEMWDREIADLARTHDWIEQHKTRPPPITGPPPPPTPSLPPPPLMALPPPILPSTTPAVPRQITPVQPAHIRPNLVHPQGPSPESRIPTDLNANPSSSLITLVNNNLNFEYGKRYTGCVVDWRQTYGFLSCTLIPGKIFLHSQSMTGASTSDLPIGISVNFELGVEASSGRFRAVRAKVFM